MKRTQIAAIVLVSAAGLIAAGCGKAKDKDKAKDEPGGGPATGSAATGTGTGAPPPPTPPAPPPPPKPSLVMPADVAADKPLSVVELDRIMKQFPDGGEILVVGYPAFFIGDNEDLRTSLELAAAPGQKSDASLVNCHLAASEAGKHVDNQTPVTMKGKLRGIWGGKHETIWLADCVVVAQGTPAKPDALPLVGAAEPAAVDKLAAAYLGWKGKEVTVTGAYFGTTISRKAPKEEGGVIIDVRIDLLTAIGNYDGKVGCHLPLEEPSAELDARMEANRAALTVRGTLKEGLARGAQLDPCTVVGP